MMRQKNIWCSATVLLLSAYSPFSLASELVYTPSNPVFGGSPANGAYLLSVAQAQNDFKAPVSSLTPLQTFQKNLQQAILARAQNKIVSSLFDKDGAVPQPQTYETLNYTIVVEPQSDTTIKITTIDKTTNAETSFVVSSNLMPIE